MWESIRNDSCDVCKCANSRAKKRTESSFDKENIQRALSPIKSQELSFYSNSTITTTNSLCSGDTSPNHCTHNLIIRRPLEDHDTNSHDSGYLTNYNSNSDKFSFNSPSNQSYKSGMDEEFLEDFSDIEPLDENLPKNFDKLITASVDNNKSEQKQQPRSTKDLRPLFRRALSLDNEMPSTSTGRSYLFDPDVRIFKRPEPPLDFPSETITKKIKLDENDSDDEDEVSTVPIVTKPILKRSVSTTVESIMSAVEKSSTEPDLIGDFSKTFCLPLTPGRHRDLKSITPQTLAQLLRGDFRANISSFKVIDCRYPYEFNGGHIHGAINIYTRDQCMDLLTNFASPIENEDTNRRNNILVFHCEFSSERGPNLCRYLRQQDRQLNQDSYPSLHYPEMYILEGGYKNFFEQYSHLCIPNAYKEMLHPEHVNELRYFRLKSRTWNVDNSRPRLSQGYSKKLSW